MHNFFRHKKPWLIIPLIFAGLTFAVILAFLFGYFVMLLWNWLLPDIFGLKKISYWQAWGLVLLCHLLFKTGPHPHHSRNPFKKDKCFDRDEFKEKMNEKLSHENESQEIKE